MLPEKFRTGRPGLAEIWVTLRSIGTPTLVSARSVTTSSRPYNSLSICSVTSPATFSLGPVGATPPQSVRLTPHRGAPRINSNFTLG